MPPSNRLESLIGARAGQWSIRINEQWRVCFRFEKGKAFGQTTQYWINLQAAYDLKMAEKVVSSRIAGIRQLAHA